MASHSYHGRMEGVSHGDVTVTDTMAQSYLPVTSQTSGAAAEAAADRKTVKYAPLTQGYLFIAIAAETMGAINSDGIEFLDDLKSLMITARKPSCINGCLC